VYWLAPSLPRDATEFMGSPATVGAFGLLAGYFLGYAVGLAGWRASVFRASQFTVTPSDTQFLQNLRVSDGNAEQRLGRTRGRSATLLPILKRSG
jgi:hypothetical protein